MTARTPHPAAKKGLFAALGAALLATPFLIPTEAKADDFKIHLNLGGSPYYTTPYAAPQRVVYVQEPRRFVYHSRPVYRERIVYRDYRSPRPPHHWHKGPPHGHDHGRERPHREYYAWR